MTADYATWRRDRLADLDLLQPQIDELPPTIRDLVQPYADTLRRHVGDLNLGGHAQSLGKYVERATRQLAAELARITVAPVSEDGEVK